MKEIAQKYMFYTLYQDGDRYLLEVVCGTVGIYELVVELSTQETAQFLENGIPWIEAMAIAIRNRPGDYFARRVQTK